MLRVTGLSLLFGAVGLVVVLTQFFAAPAPAGSPPSSITLNPDNTHFTASSGSFADGELQLTLVKSGLGVVTLETGGIETSEYPFLHIALEEPPRDLKIRISLDIDGTYTRPYLLESKSPRSMWLALNELQGWTGSANAIRLVFIGHKDQSVRIGDFSLHPASPSRQLQAIVSDFANNAPWKRANMNTHTGVTKVASFYPVPLIVTLLLFSLLGYVLLITLFRGKFKFDWNVVALIFLACWISLDLIWQNRLLYQVGNSYQMFAGKNTQAKLAVGPDSRLFQFISKVKEHLEPADARVFMSSSDLYRGMRGAYYLYPFNVYWSLEPPEVPLNKDMRKGDYVVLLKPTATRFYQRVEILKAPENRPQSAEKIYSDSSGILVRLK
jgi:hypothetical protein